MPVKKILPSAPVDPEHRIHSLDYTKTYIFKPEFSLASNIGILNRSTHWKDYRDVMRSMQAIHHVERQPNILQTNNKQPDVERQPTIGPFENDDLKTFVETFPTTPLRRSQYWGRIVWRIFTINDSVTAVYMKFITSIWGPLLLAGLYSLLQIKDIYSTSDASNNVYTFLYHIFWTLGILLALAILFVIMWKVTFIAVRSVKRYKQIIRRIRFGILQANADALNPFGKNWEWDYNSEIDDPDIAWIVFQSREAQEGDKYIWSNCLGRRIGKKE